MVCGSLLRWRTGNPSTQTELSSLTPVQSGRTEGKLSGASLAFQGARAGVRAHAAISFASTVRHQGLISYNFSIRADI